MGSAIKPKLRLIERRSALRNRVYVSRSVDLVWLARRHGDDVQVASGKDKAEVEGNARQLGYMVFK